MSSKVKYLVIGIIIISFLFFGIYSTILARQPYVAKVGGQKISIQEFNDYYSKKRDQILQNTQGDSQRQKDAINFIQTDDFKKMVATEMVNLVLIKKFLNDSGITVRPDVLLEYVKTLPEFKSNGRFDLNAFKNYVKLTGFDEYGFLKSQVPMIYELLFNNILQNFQLGSPIVAKKLADANKKFRTVEMLKIENVSIEEPSDEKLQKIYEKYKNQFVEQPQHYVVISYIDEYISQNSNIFNSSLEVIKNFYNTNFLGKEVQFYFAEFSNEHEAKKAQSIATKQGVSLSSVVNAMKLKANNSVLKEGESSSFKMESVEVLESIQNLKVGGVSSVFKKDESFFVLHVLKVLNQKFQNSSSKSISNEMKKQRKCNNVGVYVEKLRSEFKTGAMFEAIALKYGLPVKQKVIFDENNFSTRNAQNNLPVKISEKLKNHVFGNMDSQYGHVVEINEEECSFAVYRQYLISKQRVKTLPEVRGKILEIYKNEERELQKQALARSIISQISALKTNLNNYSQHGNVVVKDINLNSSLALQVFAKEVGEVFKIKENGDVFVAKIVKEVKPKTQTTDAEIDIANKQLKGAFSESYTRILMEELYGKYKVVLKI